MTMVLLVVVTLLAQRFAGGALHALGRQRHTIAGTSRVDIPQTIAHCKMYFVGHQQKALQIVEFRTK